MSATQVLERRMHAAVGDQPEQVHTRSVRERGAQHLVTRERSVGDGVVDAHEVLAHDRACAEVEMADLAVAHLPLGQAHRAPARLQRRVWVALPQLVEDGRARERYRVAGARLGEPPAVQHDQAGAARGQARRPRRQRHRGAAETIAEKDSASSEAPPTSAPSTSGSASSSTALSGFTEPP